MKMKNKTTKLRTHTSSKKGRKFRKEKSAILFFNNPQFVSKKKSQFPALRADISTFPPAGRESGYFCPPVTFPPCKT